MQNLILAINPGSTSTKIAVYQRNRQIFTNTIRHSLDMISGFPNVVSQFEFRRDLIVEELQKADIKLEALQIVVGRGGFLWPIPSGVYEVNDAMVRDLKSVTLGEHASNLGGIIARDIAQSIDGASAYIVDPIVVDEFEDVARLSGHPELERRSIFHALNQKAVARSHAEQHGHQYEDLNLIVAHLGGGITVGAHKKGRVIDVNQGLDGDGPYSPERAGSLPSGDLMRLCFSGKYTKAEIQKMITGKGGFVAYLGTNSAYDVEQKALAGDEECMKIIMGMCYQVAREVGALSTVLVGEIDGILLTGGVAYSKLVTDEISRRVAHLADVYVYPGEDEMRALATAGLRVQNGEAEVLFYDDHA